LSVAYKSLPYDCNTQQLENRDSDSLDPVLDSESSRTAIHI